MLVDDLRATISDKLNREVVKPPDPAQQPYPVHKEHHYFHLAVTKMIEESVLDRQGPLRSHG
jgi:hypothetical protein